MVKPTLKPLPFLFFFVTLVLIDLLVGSIEFTMVRQITKPLILISLLVYFGINGRGLPKSTYNLTLMALVFSLLGDIMLLFDDPSGIHFMLGLISFLIAHLFYCAVFLKQWNKKALANFWWVTLLIVSYGITLFFFLKDHLGELVIPVTIYVLGILLMAVTAYKRQGKVNITSFNMVFIGALFFIASDSILAINKFMASVPGSHILIMGTYATAQYLITRGILFQHEVRN